MNPKLLAINPPPHEIIDTAEVPIKKTLLCVLGLSPAILTETLYALLHQDDPFIPNEIEVITTQPGAKQCELAFFHDGGGWFYKFCREYGVKDIRFNEGNILTISRESGLPLEDIRTADDNAQVADLITRRVQYHTQQNSILHVSLAGGRKTMGYYAGYALSIFGRPLDRLSHVLVQQEFEGLRDFFYPTKTSKVITARNNSLLDTKDAEVSLADIPFIRLRHALDSELVNYKMSFEDIIEKVNRNLTNPPSVTLELVALQLIVDNQQVKLSTIDFIFYYWLATRAKNVLPAVQVPNVNDEDTKFSDNFMAVLQLPVFEMKVSARTLEGLVKADDTTCIPYEFFRDRRSSITRVLKKQLGAKHEYYKLILDKSTKDSVSSGSLFLNIASKNIHFV